MKMSSKSLLNTQQKKESTPAISRGCMITKSVSGSQVKSLDNDGGKKGHAVIKTQLAKDGKWPL
jgi:hypothetical protein